jgi:hypothetical protein
MNESKVLKVLNFSGTGNTRIFGADGGCFAVTTRRG